MKKWSVGANSVNRTDQFSDRRKLSGSHKAYSGDIAGEQSVRLSSLRRDTRTHKRRSRAALTGGKIERFGMLSNKPRVEIPVLRVRRIACRFYPCKAPLAGLQMRAVVPSLPCLPST